MSKGTKAKNEEETETKKGRVMNGKAEGRENGKKGDRINTVAVQYWEAGSGCCLCNPRKVLQLSLICFTVRPFSLGLSYFLPREDLAGFHAGLHPAPTHPFNQALLQAFAMPRASSPLTDQI